jgi:hypothetical protein
MRTILNLTVSLSLSFPAMAGLPEHLDVGILDSVDTVAFEGDPRTVISPVGVKLLINGAPPASREAIEEAFIDLFYARVPKDGAPILASQDAEGREIWKFPVGTQTFHVFKLRADGEPFFELRTAVLKADGTWDLGVYLQESSSATPVLRRQSYTGMPAAEARFKSTRSGRDLHVQLNRLPLHNCKMCHFNSSPSRYQFTSPDDAGPCGFGPAHPTLARDWAQAYEKRVGHSPIQR